jgi:hypothetical protein
MVLVDRRAFLARGAAGMLSDAAARRDDRQLRRRVRPRPPLVADGRGVDRRARQREFVAAVRRASRIPVRGPARSRPRRAREGRPADRRRALLARVNRLEGCWHDDDDGSTYFVSTSGGDEKNGDLNSDGFREGFGQVWEFRPRGRSGGLLILHYESPGGEALDSPDNMTVTAGGGLLLAEDEASTAYSAEDVEDVAPDLTDVNRLIGITPAGEAFKFAVNVFSEMAGVCFSPDGDTLFVNIFGDSAGTPAGHAGEGMTCAITGP